jgi:hypothetical protein
MRHSHEGGNLVLLKRSFNTLIQEVTEIDYSIK